MLHEGFSASAWSRNSHMYDGAQQRLPSPHSEDELEPYDLQGVLSGQAGRRWPHEVPGNVGGILLEARPAPFWTSTGTTRARDVLSRRHPVLGMSSHAVLTGETPSSIAVPGSIRGRTSGASFGSTFAHRIFTSLHARQTSSIVCFTKNATSLFNSQGLMWRAIDDLTEQNASL